MVQREFQEASNTCGNSYRQHVPSLYCSGGLNGGEKNRAQNAMNTFIR
jgi:hypothetical protein